MNPYADPATGTLVNKLGIRDSKDLQLVEYRVSAVRIEELALNPIRGDFDLRHLKAIHGRIFGDVYEWAGQERTINFSKRDMKESWWKATFADHKRIGEVVQQASDELKASGYLRGMSQPDFVAGLTKFYVVVNHAHPFPEGNGRSTQTMITQLAREAGYEVRFDAVDRERWNHAAARSMPQTNVREPALTRPAEPKLIHAVFKDITRPLERDRGVER